MLCTVSPLLSLSLSVSLFSSLYLAHFLSNHSVSNKLDLLDYSTHSPVSFDTNCIHSFKLYFTTFFSSYSIQIASYDDGCYVLRIHAPISLSLVYPLLPSDKP
uniref:Putative secreted protein n=1 Tax=Anopheles triannulatus TaxID=58253 RepID=A0A2M4B2L2_9DIPT